MRLSLQSHTAEPRQHPLLQFQRVRIAQPRDDHQLTAVERGFKLLRRHCVDMFHVPFDLYVLPVDLDRRGAGVVGVRPVRHLERLRLADEEKHARRAAPLKIASRRQNEQHLIGGDVDQQFALDVLFVPRGGYSCCARLL
jgi:hypothetical protein